MRCYGCMYLTDALLPSGRGTESGAVARIRMCDFKLKSDSIAVPSINIDDFSLEVSFKLTIILSFDTKKRKWSALGDDFRLNILEFKGPFVLTKGVVSAIMGIAVPIIRDDLLKELPSELGLFVSSIPLPLHVNGIFGIDSDFTLDSIFGNIFMSQNICELTDCSPQLLLHFIAIQKSLERKDLLISMMDLMRYKRHYEAYEPQWNSLKSLWDEASLIYFAQTVRRDPAAAVHSSGIFGSSAPSQQDFSAFLAFDKLLLGADKVRKNELNFRVDLNNIEGQIGLKNGMTNLHLYLMRMIEQISNSTANLSAAQYKLLEDASEMLSELSKKFNLVLKHVDHVHNKVKVILKTGPGGFGDFSLKDFSAQAPIALWAALPADHVVSLDHFIVPTLVNIKTSKEGLLSTNFYHMGCHQMMERAHYVRFFAEHDANSEVNFSTSLPVLNDSIDDAENTEYSKMGSEVISSTILRPHFSLVLDKAMSLPAGAELFTVNIGPLDRNWVPFGSCVNSDRSYLADIKPKAEECPILLQTSDQIKIVVKSPEIRSYIRLQSLVRYLEEHFKKAKNVDRLLEVLMQVSDDVESNMQYINFSSLLVSFMSKYVDMPNFEINLDISVNMIANAGDVIVCIENNKQDNSALTVLAKVNFGELLKDTTGLKSAFFNCFN